MKQQELLASQMNAEKHSNSSELIQRVQMKDTPFWIIGTPETQYFGTLGKYQVTEKFPTIQAVQDHIENGIWEMIIKIAGIVAADLIEQNDKIKNKQQFPINKV